MPHDCTRHKRAWSLGSSVRRVSHRFDASDPCPGSSLCNADGRWDVTLYKRTASHPDRSRDGNRGPARRAGAGGVGVRIRADRPALSASDNRAHRPHRRRSCAGRRSCPGIVSEGLSQPVGLRHHAPALELAVPDRPQHGSRSAASLATCDGEFRCPYVRGRTRPLRSGDHAHGGCRRA